MFCCDRNLREAERSHCFCPYRNYYVCHAIMKARVMALHQRTAPVVSPAKSRRRARWKEKI